jgi:conjugal transfer pilus assembly protein TraV
MIIAKNLHPGFKLSVMAALVAASVSGCAVLSGYDASDSFSCKAPEGVSCESMSGVYANMEANNLPGQKALHSGSQDSSADVSAAPGTGVMTTPIYSGTPIRTPAKVLRNWFAPWGDSVGDFHDQNYVYVTVDTGHFLVDHNRRQIQEAYRPITPPINEKQAAAGSGSAAQSSNTPSPNIPATSPDQISIGSLQAMPTAQEAAALVKGLVTPAQAGATQDPKW